MKPASNHLSAHLNVLFNVAVSISDYIASVVGGRQLESIEKEVAAAASSSSFCRAPGS